jgi:hypothetical protein
MSKGDNRCVRLAAAWRSAMTIVRIFAVASAIAAAAAVVPSSADARGAGGGANSGSARSASGHGHGGSAHWRGGAGHWRGGSGHWHGGSRHWHGGWHGGYWGHRGYWPGAFWGFGVGTGYYGGYYGGYYPAYVGPTWGTVVYDAPLITSPVYGVEPSRVGQPVPQVAPAADPIFYPRHGQSAETIENDRRDCNRWATTQHGALTDASIFQRATLACMEGRGYTVK